MFVTLCGEVGYKRWKRTFDRTLLALFPVLLVIVGALSASSIDEAKVALETANKVTGFNSLPRTQQSLTSAAAVVPVLMVDTNTPFVYHEINGRSAWKVVYPAVDLNSDDQQAFCQKGEALAAGLRIGGIRNMTVWLDSLTGVPLRCEIRTSDWGERIRQRLPTADEAAAEISGLLERYHGIPSEPPTLTMMEALQRCKTRPYRAAEITVQYLLFSSMNTDTIPFAEMTREYVLDPARRPRAVPVWVIYMRGLPRMYLSHPASEPAMTTIRVVVDAMSGEVYSISNIPVPKPGVDPAGE